MVKDFKKYRDQMEITVFSAMEMTRDILKIWGRTEEAKLFSFLWGVKENVVIIFKQVESYTEQEAMWYC